MGTVEKDLKKTGDLASAPKGQAPKGMQTVPSSWIRHSSWGCMCG